MSLHLRFQFYHASIDGELAISMVVDGLSVVLRKVHPRFDDLENEETVRSVAMQLTPVPTTSWV
jgi:hypothetical protein